MEISEVTKKAILDFLDTVFPKDSEVWITGSRAIGTNSPDSDWDVLVVSKYCPKKREDVFDRATQDSQFLVEGGPIQAVCVHPDVLASDSRLYFVDCRKYGIKLRIEDFGRLGA